MPVHKRSMGFGMALGLGFLLLSSSILSGCAGAAPRTIKIGLVAPFDGRYREIGEEIIPAARLAIRQFAALNKDPAINIELAAYDDAGDPQQAAEQACRLVIDPEVVAVIGHWRSATTQAAAPIYAQANLPLIVFNTSDVNTQGKVYNLASSDAQMEAAAQEWLGTQDLTGALRLESQDGIVAVAEQFRTSGGAADGALIGGPSWGLRQFYALTGHSAEDVYFVTNAGKPGDVRSDFWTDERTLQFVAGFDEGSLGASPGLFSLSAYEATWLAISLATREQLDASPLNVSQFDQTGRRLDAPIYLYRWEEGQREFITQLQ